MSITTYGLLKKTDFTQSLITFIECMLPKGTQDKVLVIPLRFEAAAYDESIEEMLSVVEECEMYIHSPGNYVFVGVGLKGSVDKIKKYAYHDSCWRNDGVERVVIDYVTKVTDATKKEREGLEWDSYTRIGGLLRKPYLIDAVIEDKDSEDFVATLKNKYLVKGDIINEK